MDVWVDHHQHEIVDPFAGDELPHRPLDHTNRLALLGEGCAGQFAVRLALAFGREHDRTEGHLRRPQEHQPVLEFLEQAGWVTELLDGRVHLAPLSLRSDAAALKWPARRREPLPAKSWRS